MSLEKINEVLKPLIVDKGFKENELTEFANIIGKNVTEESTEDDIKNAVAAALPYAELIQKVGNRYASGIETKYKGFVSPDVLTQEKKAAADALKAREESLSAEFTKVFEEYKRNQEVRLADIMKNKPQQAQPQAQNAPQTQTNVGLTREEISEMIKQQTQPAFTAEKLVELIGGEIEKAFAPYKEKAERERLDALLRGHEKMKSIPTTFLSLYRLDKEADLDDLLLKIETDYANTIQEQIKSGEFAVPQKGQKRREEDDVLKFLNSIAQKK